MEINIDPTTTKYVVRAKIQADGIIEKPDVVGAIFGQTEGLLGEDMDLRDLQKSGRIGRIEASVNSHQGRSSGEIIVPSSLDQIETAILAASLETIDRVGPCKSRIEVLAIEDVREVKKKQIADRAKVLLQRLVKSTSQAGGDIADEVRRAVVVEEVVSYGEDRLPAGPNVGSSDAIIVVEGRSDVLNLLRHGVKNAIAVEGTHIPQTIIDASKEKVVTAFVDGDRGGELILRELLQVAEVDFICRAPRSHEVEELTQKQLMKALKDKIPADQFTELYGVGSKGHDRDRGRDRGRGRDRRRGRGRGGARDFDPRRRDRGGRGDGGSRDRDRDGNGGGDGDEDTGEYDETDSGSQDTGEGSADDSGAEPSGDETEAESPTPEAAGVQYSEEQRSLAQRLRALMGAQKAALVEETGTAKEVPLSDLAAAIEAAGTSTRSIVLDGIISQRILDLANKNRVHNVVGVRRGQIVKAPVSVDVFTADEIGA